MRKRGGKADVVTVNVIRRQQFILDEDLRELWLLSLATTSWRSHKDVVKKSWKGECNAEKMESSVMAMSELLENELSPMKKKQEKEGNDSVNVVHGAKSEKKGKS